MTFISSFVERSTKLIMTIVEVDSEGSGGFSEAAANLSQTVPCQIAPSLAVPLVCSLIFIAAAAWLLVVQKPVQPYKNKRRPA